MNRKIKRIVVALSFVLFAFSWKVQAQSAEVQQLLLNVEKLTQFKQILSDMKKGYQTLSTGYGLVKNISQGNFSLHETFLNGLYLVSPEVRKYQRIGDILRLQSGMVSEYKAAFGRFKNGGRFSVAEIGYLEKVYGQLLKLSLLNLEELAMVVTSGQLRMSDEERLKAIDRLFLEMEDRVVFLRDFNQRTSLLAFQREKESVEIGRVRALYP